jgi:hypothetical protein
VTLANAVENGVLAHAPMQEVGLDETLRFFDLAAVPGKIGAFGPCGEEFEGADIGPHMAFGRRHHAGVPAHHVIAGKQDVRSLERKAEVIRRVPRREQRLE